MRLLDLSALELKLKVEFDLAATQGANDVAAFYDDVQSAGVVFHRHDLTRPQDAQLVGVSGGAQVAINRW